MIELKEGIVPISDDILERTGWLIEASSKKQALKILRSKFKKLENYYYKVSVNYLCISKISSKIIIKNRSKISMEYSY